MAEGLRILREPLSLFICQEIQKEYGDSWWAEGVLQTLVYEKLRPTVESVLKFYRLPQSGSVEDCASALDISVCLILLTKHGYRIFDKLLGKEHKNWAFELINVRNQNKHPTGEDHASDFTWRALDTMYRLIKSIDADKAAELVTLRSAVDLSEYGQAFTALAGTSTPAAVPNVVTATSTPPSSGLDSPSMSAPDLDEDLAVLGPNFSGAFLRDMDFAGANLEGADFTDANLIGANLEGAVLRRATFKNANLGAARLANADLTGATFQGTDLSQNIDGVCRGADFTGAKLDGATLNFAGALLRNVNFPGANLEGADFTDANLIGANLEGAVLRRATFKSANLGAARLANADLTGATFQGTDLSQNIDGVCRGADFTGAKLDGATLDFAGAFLRNVNFPGANLEGADFTDANLIGASLKGAILRGVNLKGANIKDANTSNVQWT
ncbi:pentapeptide repeat-containing protein [Oryzobacter terrae]|uniref:pentapeptide repeat-containing protein n=1 Tax=Oryzobacter terrae TaxID=1620385 RepID=UPI003670AEFE